MTAEAPGGAPHPYIPGTAADRAAILERLGLASSDELFADLPAQFRDPDIELPPALAEPDLIRLLEARAAANGDPGRPSFLGAGAYSRAVPSIASYLAGRSEFVTAYTPYQPEISQGTLQSAFEYQSVVCELTGMDVSNTGLYDVASATAEACLLAARVTGRQALALLEPLHPHTAEVVRTYASGTDLRVDILAEGELPTAEHACLVAQQPDFLGTIRDLEPLAEAAHALEALLVAVADPFALGLLRAPGDAGADVVTGEGRDLAGGVHFGGPSLGLFAARETHLRQLPGRIVGRTRELAARPSTDGGLPPRSGYVLTLQAREQFIRRERAHLERLDGAGARRARLHRRRPGARPRRPARGRRALLPARARRRDADRHAARLRRRRARPLVPGVPAARSAARGGAPGANSPRGRSSPASTFPRVLSVRPRTRCCSL